LHGRRCQEKLKGRDESPNGSRREQIGTVQVATKTTITEQYRL